jgi:hypothetical protein
MRRDPDYPLRIVLRTGCRSSKVEFIMMLLLSAGSWKSPGINYWGERTMGQRRFLCTAMVTGLTIGLLAGCGTSGQADNEALPAFTSMDEAYAAVDEVLGCDAEPAGEPIVPADGSPLTSEQKLCSENVQIDLYPDEASLQKALEIWTGSNQGEVQVARGSNWMVVDVTDVATGESSTRDIEGVAEELNGEYTVTGA